ncbi:hypothetical protein AALP_AA3G356200 [Arabis alpina]|uniref:Uncharacterized protein n=1 Tax=Arabis alpina TaxID=50452 RepID=A0A087HDU1_ARAAL|nr:hypothetical protein AALP_AA3G356200 [Arabis alpina]
MDTSNVLRSTTNWRLAGGKLTDCISFESSVFSPSSVDNHIPKSPLLLLPNGNDPCEITITFAQEHELKQVYIRSTARVYEVYYTQKKQNEREYLCTVRCSVVAREEEEEEVVQDFYEATAEINDAESCISITLRLVSLEDKGCAIVDEIYVFADQSELEKEEEVNGTANSSTSSLMAMFMPTLLQLSRVKERDRQVSDYTNLKNSTDSGKIVNEIQQESSPMIVDTLARHVDATRAETKPCTSCNSNVETILEQLVNKVSRIETILTRFEDQMLRPINSIDARLQLVEKQLEQLSKKSSESESELLVEAEIPNPDSVGSSTAQTPETNELDGLTKHNSQLASSDSSSIDNSEDNAVVLPKNGLDNSISGNEVISVESEISSEEAGHSLERGATEKNLKPSLSINDALASALAGLLSSTSVTDGKYGQALVVTDPESLNEDDMEMEKKPLDPEESQVLAEEFGSRRSVSDSLVSEPKITEDNSQEMINGVSEKLGDSLGGYDEAETVISVRKDDLEKETVTSSAKADERENMSYEPGNHELEEPNVTNGCGGSRFVEPELDGVLKSVLGFQPTTCSVDFQTSVLDVKFNPEKKISEKSCFFEALLTPESQTVVVDCNKDAVDDNLVLVEYEELKCPPTDTLSSVEMVHYETNEMMHPQLNEDISTTSLI